MTLEPNTVVNGVHEVKYCSLELEDISYGKLKQVQSS